MLASFSQQQRPGIKSKRNARAKGISQRIATWLLGPLASPLFYSLVSSSTASTFLSLRFLSHLLVIFRPLFFPPPPPPHIAVTLKPCKAAIFKAYAKSAPKRVDARVGRVWEGNRMKWKEKQKNPGQWRLAFGCPESDSLRFMWPRERRRSSSFPLFFHLFHSSVQFLGNLFARWLDLQFLLNVSNAPKRISPITRDVSHNWVVWSSQLFLRKNEIFLEPFSSQCYSRVSQMIFI